MRYDGHDRQNRWVFPSKTTAGSVNESDFESYAYDDGGNRTSLRKRDGTTLTHLYDGLNRVTSKTVPSSASGAPGYWNSPDLPDTEFRCNHELGGVGWGRGPLRGSSSLRPSS